MTREEVMEMAYESGVIGGYEGEPDLLERFAALVAQAERDKFCAVLRQLHDSYSLASTDVPRSNT